MNNAYRTALTSDSHKPTPFPATGDRGVVTEQPRVSEDAQSVDPSGKEQPYVPEDAQLVDPSVPGLYPVFVDVM